MDILNRKLIRDLWQSRGQFLSVLIVVIIGVMFYSGINAAFRNLSGASEIFYHEYRFGHLWANVYKAPESMEDKLQALPFIEKVTGRIVQDVKIGIGGENATIRLITLPDLRKDIVNDVMITSGRYFSDAASNQCLLEEGFFKAHHLTLGDTISPVINGTEVKMKVIGTVINPEYIYAIKDGSELMPDYHKFGIVYVKKSFGQAILGFEGSVNNFSLILKDEADVDQAKDDIKKALKQFGVKEIIQRDDQLSNRMVSEKIKGLKSVGGAFPVAFFMVAAVIIYITMGRMVENQRVQIGVLKAFGFSDFQILLHYLSYAAFIAVLGSILGSVLGMYLGKAFTELQNMYFNFPMTHMRMYPDLVVPASLLTLAFCLLAGYNACKRVFRIMPCEAMRPTAPLKGRKIFIEKIAFVWKRIGYDWKIILRNVFRYKRRALLTSIGVIFATALTVVAFGEKSSVDYMILQQYGNIQGYDIKVSFSKFLNEEELNLIRNISHISRLEPLVEAGVEISNGWRKKDVGFTALVPNPDIYKVTDKNGTPVTPPSNGVLLPDKLARVLGAAQYDTVYIRPFLPGKEKKEVQIKGTVVQYLGTSVYSSLESISSLLGEGMIANAVVIKLDSSSHEKQVVDALKEIPAVSSVQSKSDAMNNLIKNMAAMTSAIGVMIVLAAVLSVAVIYNIASINIFERRRELATLKVLGFKDSEVRSLIFNENYLITIFGILVGLPFGKILGTSMMASYETDAYTFPFVIGIETYILAAVLTILFTMIANLILVKKIEAINLVEVLKSNE